MCKEDLQKEIEKKRMNFSFSQKEVCGTLYYLDRLFCESKNKNKIDIMCEDDFYDEEVEILRDCLRGIYNHYIEIKGVYTDEQIYKRQRACNELYTLINMKNAIEFARDANLVRYIDGDEQFHKLYIIWKYADSDLSDYCYFHKNEKIGSKQCVKSDKQASDELDELGDITEALSTINIMQMLFTHGYIKP